VAEVVQADTLAVAQHFETVTCLLQDGYTPELRHVKIVMRAFHWHLRFWHSMQGPAQVGNRVGFHMHSMMPALQLGAKNETWSC
jgi:hypothetical protein